MNTLRFASAVFLAILFLLPAPVIFAHGGGHKPEAGKVEESAATDSMYSVKESEIAPLSDSGNDPMFSPTDLFTQDELVDPNPMEDKEMKGGHNEHAGPQVQLASHEWVSSSSKGFGTAVGITLFAGIAFAGLTFIRRGE
ncbi:MAG: hypothetical protein H8E42_12415 [Nitrospinae bacterium]|nr:hypothetical protein [Nitrospinota bacterium]MBL7021397.1 hypothetical protein [Nitrospinaceae bacterium]